MRVPTPGGSSGGDSDDSDEDSDASRSSSGGSSTRTERVSRRARNQQRSSSSSSSEFSSAAESQSGGEESMAVDEAPQEDAAEVTRATPDPRVERGARRAREAEQAAVMEPDDVRTRTEAAERFREERAKEQARQQIARENEDVDVEDIDSLERTDDGYRAGFTDEFRTEQARKQAAVEDPLRDSEDFVATAEDGDVNVRRRQAPLFEEYREKIGGDPPEESPVFRRIQKGSKAIQSGVKKYTEIEERQDPTTAATTRIGDQKINLDEADRGATLGAGSVLNLPGAALDARTVASQGVEYGQAALKDESTPVDIEADERQPVQAAESKAALGVGENQREELKTSYEAVKSQKEAVQEAYAENPDVTTGALAGAVATGAALPSGGLAVPRAARRGVSRVRTLGSRRVPETDTTQGRTARVFDPDVPDEPTGARFPGATDRQKYQERPAAAIREQAQRNDPDVIRERFDEAGVEETAETADLYKAVETEPDSSGRGVGGFRSPEVEARDAAETYEVESGTFFGPDLSPNFFRTNFGEPEVRLRPGIPRLGDRPTAFAARGRVREPEADDIRGLERELQSADDPVFRTKPADDINPDEAEAVLPEGTELADIGNRGAVESAARRLGIGSDFSVKIGNRRIPLRPVADPELTNGGDSRVRQLLADDRGQAGAGSADGGDLIAPRRYTVGGRRRPASRAVDRPLPAVGAPADSPAETDVGSVSDFALPDTAETGAALSSLPSSSEFSDSGGSRAGGPPVGSSAFSTGASDGSSSAFGGSRSASTSGRGGGSSGTVGGGGDSSTSYGGSGFSSTSGGGGGGSAGTGPPTQPTEINPPTQPTQVPPGTPPQTPRRCRDRHTKQEDDPRPGDIALGENEWPNPVAAPDELDDVAADVLGRDEPNRRTAKDLLADLPGDTDDDRRGPDPLRGFL